MRRRMCRPVAALLLLLALAVVACSGILGPERVEIRLRNTSETVLGDVVVTFPDGPVSYGDVESGSVTPYRAVDRAYRYAAVRAVVDGDTLRVTPVDYVGESLLEGGAYTYQIGRAGSGSLTLEMLRD